MDLYTLPGVINKCLFVQEAFSRVSQHLPQWLFQGRECVRARVFARGRAHLVPIPGRDP